MSGRRTTAELVARLAVSEELVEEWMADWLERGIVELVDGGWRLTRYGDRVYGQAVRNLEAPEEIAA